MLFDSLLVSRLHGFTDVWLGHERSADEGNGVFWRGREVNHQFDKSSVFLNQAREYIRIELAPSSSTPSSSSFVELQTAAVVGAVREVETATTAKDSTAYSSSLDASTATDVHTTDVRIVSALSDMWELEISKQFCRDETLQKFHSVYLSCNEPVGEYKCEWCMRCEKCCFVYLIMSAWLPSAYVINDMFKMRVRGTQGEGLYHDMTLLSTFQRLVSGGADSGMKAFECVGTFAEASAAVELSLLRHTEVYVATQLQSATRTVAGEYMALSLDKEKENQGVRFTHFVPPVLAALCEHLNLPLDAFIQSVITATANADDTAAAVTTQTDKQLIGEIESQIMSKWNNNQARKCS